MTRTRTLGLVALCSLGLAGCDMLEEVLADVLDIQNLSLLGIMPAAQFGDPDSPDRGKLTLAMGADDDRGLPIKPDPEDIELEDENGEDIPVEGGEPRPGYDQGSFVLLVDGSASLEQSGPGCEGCPTDPQRFRVQAAQQLSEQLAACGPDWRQSLMEFSTELSDRDFTWSRVLADFDDDPRMVMENAPMLSSDGGTPLWDATYEVLDSLVDDSVKQYGGNPKADPADYGVGLVVISDGADTGSDTSLDKLIAHAVDLGVPVHTIGLGPASDAVEDFAQPEAVEGLRRLAQETGGYYGYVTDAAELPDLTQAIAKATCGGYTEVYARFPEPKESGERQWGTVKLKGTPIRIPFTFTVP